MGEERKGIVAFWGTFYENDVGLEAVEGFDETPGGARAVVTNAKNVDAPNGLGQFPSGAINIHPAISLFHHGF